MVLSGKNEHLKSSGSAEFLAFSQKHWEGGLMPLQIIISSHLFIENTLDRAILEVMPNDENVLKLSFSNKLTVASSSGLDPELVKILLIVNKLRNKYAHNLDYEIKWLDVRELAIKDRHTKDAWDKDMIAVLRRILSYTMGRAYAGLRKYAQKKLK